MHALVSSRNQKKRVLVSALKNHLGQLNSEIRYEFNSLGFIRKYTLVQSV